jgi:hypothetical protein
MLAIEQMFSIGGLGRRYSLDSFGERDFLRLMEADFAAPKSRKDVVKWFDAALNIAERLALSEGLRRRAGRELIANAFGLLWSRVGLERQLADIAERIGAHSPWPEGWFAIRREIRRFDPDEVRGFFLRRKVRGESIEALKKLEAALRPKNLVERVHAFALTGARARRDDLGGELSDSETPESESLFAFLAVDERQSCQAVELGQEVAVDCAALAQSLPEIVTGPGGYLPELGRGIALGAPDPEAIWRRLYASFAATITRHSNMSVLAGFLRGLAERDSELTDRLLNEVGAQGPIDALWKWADYLNIESALDWIKRTG